jgi:hypothetical protein
MVKVDTKLNLHIIILFSSLKCIMYISSYTYYTERERETKRERQNTKIYGFQKVYTKWNIHIIFLFSFQYLPNRDILSNQKGTITLKNLSFETESQNTMFIKTLVLVYIYDLWYQKGSNVGQIRILQIFPVLEGLQCCLTNQNLSHNFVIFWDWITELCRHYDLRFRNTDLG